jgi:hypothetical protein
LLLAVVTPLHGDLAEVFVGGHLDAVADGVAVAVVVVERAVLDEHVADVARGRDERAVVVVGRRLGRVNGHIADRAVNGGADGDAVAAAHAPRDRRSEVERAVLDGDLVNVPGASQRALISNISRSVRTARKTGSSSTLAAGGIGLEAQASAAVVAGFNIGHLDVADIAVIGDVGDAVAVVVDLDGGTGSAPLAPMPPWVGSPAGLDGLDVGPGDLADVAAADAGRVRVRLQAIAAKPVLLADLVGEADPADLLALSAQEDAEPKAKVGSARLIIPVPSISNCW